MRSFEQEFFHSPEPDRNKFLSRLFGIFNESRAPPVRVLTGPLRGSRRPTVRLPGERRGHTLDFTLRRRETRKVDVAN